MSALTGITIVKKMAYRADANEEYSNQYHLTGSVPADGTAWTTLIDALIAQEKTLYLSSVTVVRAYGYATDNPDDASVFSYDLSAAPVAGTLAIGSGIRAPGDAAVWVRWKTSRLNTKGKPIYLRKYFHPALATSAGSFDLVLAAQVTALNAFGTKLMDGSFADARTIRSLTHAETLLSRASSTYITTRTLKRRGRRPTS